jgi:hypothetical protein
MRGDKMVVIRGKDVYKVIKKSGLSAIKVNGEKINEHVLEDGDVLEVGGRRFKFKAVENP